MLTQYCKLIHFMPADVWHCASQTTPFEEGVLPVTLSEQTPTVTDFELDADITRDHRAGVGFMRPADILAAVEVRGNGVAFKAAAPAAIKNKILAWREVDCSQTATRGRALTVIRDEIAAAGATETDFISVLLNRGRNVLKLEDLETRALLMAVESFRV